MSRPLKVWSRFSVIKESIAVKLCIVEPPQERFNDVVELVGDYFATEECTIKAVGIPYSEEAMKEYKEMYLEVLKNEATNTLVCCLDNGNEVISEIIGASFISLADKDEHFYYEPKTKEVQKLFEIEIDAAGRYDVMAKQKVDKCYQAKGIVVHRNYRGLGIAQELYKVRRLVSKERGVSLLSAIMTSPGSYKAAQRDGWETVYEFIFEEYEKKFDIKFESAMPTAKLMIVRV